ncbi:hypothetical protein F5Y03DRAFT_125467 [Xylaria venustula]|nr:hypothetical protein F5Y03DRAFT_125467 [Xylaria venustula]
MAERKTFAVPISAWTSFINSTMAVPSSSTASLPILDLSSPSPLPSSSPLPTTAISSTSSSLVSIPLPTRSSDVPTTTLPSSPIASFPAAESVSSLLLVPTTISSSPISTHSVIPTSTSDITVAQITDIAPPSSTGEAVSDIASNTASSLPGDTQLSSPTSSITVVTTPNQPTSRSSGPPSLNSVTTSDTRQTPQPLDTWSQDPTRTIINPSPPLTGPTNTPTPLTKHDKPQVLVILAIVISAVIFLLISSIVLRKLALQRQLRRSHQGSPPQPQGNTSVYPPLKSGYAGSSHSFSAMYHGALRGAVHVVTSPFAAEESWSWPDRPGYHAVSESARPERGEGSDLTESDYVLDERSGMNRGNNSVNKVGIGRAY